MHRHRVHAARLACVLVPLAVVACGAAVPSHAPGSAAASSSSPPAAGGSVIGSSPADAASVAPASVPATTGFAAPTPEPARTVRVPEVACPTTYGLPGDTMPPLPATMTATLTSDVADAVTYYGNGVITLLGPKGWHCDAAVGADGSARMTITPPGQAAGFGSPSPDEQAVTAYTGGACVGCIASMACGLFPEAWNLFAAPGMTCPARVSSRERVSRPGPQSAVFEDPPGVAGSGEPSGGRYRAFGFVVFDPGSAAGGTGRTLPSALKVTCTLPDELSQICDELIEGASHS